MSALKKAFSRQLSVARLAKRVSLLIFTILFIANLFIFTSSAFAACKLGGIGTWCPLGTDNYNDQLATQRFGENTLGFGYITMFGRSPLGTEVLTTKVASKIENGQEVLIYTPGISKGDYNNGALAIATQGIIALYNPPTSSIEYLANLGESIGIAPKNAYAQSVSGAGANVIKPVYNLWQVTRNIAYIGFILVFITAGVMIMFRQKLNPQTVIGIQQALPGLIIGLILVTFSYFIAAFIVDLTFVGMRLVATVFTSTETSNYYADDNTNPKATFNSAYQKSDAFQMYGSPAVRFQTGFDVLGGVWGVISLKPQSQNGNFNNDWGNFATRFGTGAATGCAIGALGGLVGCAIMAAAGGTIGGIASFFNLDPGTALAGGAISLLSAILVPLILAIALMIQFIRLIIALLMSYIQILVMVIFGPFLILFSAIPGRGGTLGYWLKALFANVLVFPAVFAGFLFAGMLLNFEFKPTAAMPLFGGIGTDIIGTLLAFGVLLGLPSIPDMVREALGVKGPKGFTQAALGGFMGGVSGAQTGYKQGMQQSALQGRKEAMAKAELETKSQQFQNTPPTGFWNNLLKKTP